MKIINESTYPWFINNSIEDNGTGLFLTKDGRYQKCHYTQADEMGFEDAQKAFNILSKRVKNPPKSMQYFIENLSEANSRQVSNSLSPVISGLYTTLGELETLCKKSSNNEIELRKKDLQKLIKEINSARRTMSEIIKTYDSEETVVKDSIIKEGQVTDQISSDELHKIMSSTPDFGSFSSYRQLDGMIVQTISTSRYDDVGPHGAVNSKSRYWKFNRQDNGDWEVYEVDRNGISLDKDSFVVRDH